MLFEFSIAKKYLIPKKKRLAMSLIALMSIGVISLVVWLVLVFLSVIAGIEKGWIHKLTALNAPLRITPTAQYYASYYYRVDELCADSNYTPKNIAEKRASLVSNPYHPEEDPEIPTYWPSRDIGDNGELKDLVKLAFREIKGASSERTLVAQDYEISAAQLNLYMTGSAEGQFSQLSYLASLCSSNPQFQALLEPPRTQDLNHLMMLASLAPSSGDTLTGEATCQKRLHSLFSATTITRLKTARSKWRALFDLLPENVPFEASAQLTQKGAYTHIFLPLHTRSEMGKKGKRVAGHLIRQGDEFFFAADSGVKAPIDTRVALQLDQPLSMKAKWVPTSFDSIHSLRDLLFDVETTFQGKQLKGRVSWDQLEIEEATTQTTFSKKPEISPPWPYLVSEEMQVYLPKIGGVAQGVIIPKSMQKNGVKIGDNGSFGYKTATISSVQEQLLPITVVGFYDPGIMGMGPKPVLTHLSVIRDINLSTDAPALIPYPTNGIQVWFDDLSQTEVICANIKDAFKRAGIAHYFSITPFYEYEFAQDLLHQFKSDKYLLTLIAALILIVACTNIISLLVILVSEKKREISILRAMGASKKSIALIFTVCGGVMGMLSTLIGMGLAFLTLHNIDLLVEFLSFLQGQEAFNAAFYGNSLPKELSSEALKFIAIATPLSSLLAGLIPALKACRCHPSEVLRS